MTNWYVIYTKPKAEDSTANLLSGAEIETLNPRIQIRKYVRRKYTDVIEHLFPCYIFARFDKEKQTHMIKYTRGVRYIVGKDNPVPVPGEIIAAIQERIEGEILIPAKEDFEKGDRIVVREGPFRNFYGVFEGNISGKERAMILLDALHVKLDIEERSITKA
jgi:transcription elongation factor/antiterminator RfaH